jgi:hypothetical protein
MSTLLEQASLVLIPSGYKEDVVYSQIPTNGNGDLSFTRASNGTRINSAGLVEVCPWNLVQQSNAFSTSPWNRAGTTLTSGQTDPNGGANAWKVEFAAGSSYLYQPGIVATGVVTMSAYLRADSTTTIGFNDGNAYPNSVTIGTTWQRYEFSFNVTGANTAVQFDNYFGVSPANLAKTFYIWGAQLNIGSTAKPYFPTTDRLNVPRLTYQNGGGGCPSLLLEKQSTNLLTYSEQFDNAAWTKFAASISANSTTSPDGTQNADTLIGDGSNSDHGLLSSGVASVVSGTSYSTSIFAKANTNNFLQIVGSGAPYPGTTYANFNLANGTIGNYGVNVTPKIEDFGNGWYRCTMTAAATNSTSTNTYIIGLITSATSSRGESNTLATSVYIWGAQLEASSYPTSYINTTSASATRVADACSKTGISSLIGQTEGVIFADIPAQIFNFGAYQTVSIIYPNAGLGSTYLHFYKNVNSRTLFFEVWNSTSQCSMSFSMSDNTRYKVAAVYKNNDFALYVNGVAVGTDPTGTVASVTYSTLEIGYDSFNTDSQISLSEFVLFKTRLTNAELASLTTI